ncbi:MAG: pyridoxal phosphate-dependent aminotransferase [Fimbriimonadaceae bacterium]|nr:pyridoxal phosphate-dependent aminotransferase [Fimbriimonadaceae bacterium]
MPKLSERAHAMPASPIRKLMPYAESAKRRGVHIYHLNIGQPDVETPAEFWNAIRDFPNRTLEYSHSAGIESLRKRCVESYRAAGLEIETADLMVTTAGSEALIFALLCCLNPGDEVIVPEPFYANYNGFAVQAGVTVVPIRTYIENDFALPPAEAFERVITPRTRAIVICNPNNPTGTVYDRPQLEGLREIVLRHDLYLFADEVYREFVYTGTPPTSVLSLAGLEGHAVVFDSVSKKFSACGARVGFLISRNHELMEAALRFGQARLSAPTLEQHGAEAALDAPRSYFEGVRTEYMARRDALVAALRTMNGVVCPKIDGAFYATVRLPIDDGETFARWLLEHHVFEGSTVMLAPADGFYATKGAGKDEVRIAYVLGVDRIVKAMECLRRALATYPGRTCEQAVAAGV